VTDWANADFLQVLLREAREDPLAYLILAECRLVMFEAKAPQPNHDVHGGALILLGAEASCLARRTGMSQMGQPRRFDLAPFTSGLPRLADVVGVRRYVSIVPTGDITPLIFRAWYYHGFNPASQGSLSD
jgi:hypothetical protein